MNFIQYFFKRRDKMYLKNENAELKDRINDLYEVIDRLQDEILELKKSKRL